MNTTSKTLLLLLPLLCGPAMAAPDAAEELAALTAKNMAIVSTSLTAFGEGVNDTAATRAAHILTVRNLAYAGHKITTDKVRELQRNDGGEIVKLFEALREHGDIAAQAPLQAAAADAAAKAEIAASYAPLKISTEKLDSAATTLAKLSKEQTDAERAKFLVQFMKDTRDETKRLLEEAKAPKATADDAMKTKVDESVAAHTKKK